MEDLTLDQLRRARLIALDGATREEQEEILKEMAGSTLTLHGDTWVPLEAYRTAVLAFLHRDCPQEQMKRSVGLSKVLRQGCSKCRRVLGTVLIIGMLLLSGCSFRRQPEPAPEDTFFDFDRGRSHNAFLAEWSMEDECMFDYFPECGDREMGD